MAIVKKVQKADVRWLDLLNGLVVAMGRGDYKQGCRNDMMVDFTAACYMLGLDPHEELDDIEGMGVIISANDDEDTHARITRILDYKSDLVDWYWLINPDEYVILSKYVNLNPDTPIIYQFKD